MLTFEEYIKEEKQRDPCWKGYKQLGYKKKEGKSVPNCIPEETEDCFDLDDTPSTEEVVNEAEYQGKEVKLYDPFRTPDGPKKFAVYVKNADGKVIIVRFGDPHMEIKRDDPERRKNFRARHSCDTATDKTTPRYWSCQQWRAGAKVNG